MIALSDGFRNNWRDVIKRARLIKSLTNHSTRTGKHGSPNPEYAFLHQSEAIEELLSPGAWPVVVTTGTGSGKTEAFLLPVIQNAIEDAIPFNSSLLSCPGIS